jgi:hypothetical protein
MKRLTKFLLSAVAVAGLGAPASAVAFDITLAGRIATGADDRGLFGPAHTSLGGKEFSIHYTLDPGPLTTTVDTDGISPLYRFDTPGRLTVDVTIDGITFTYRGTAQSVYTKSDHAAAGGNPAFSLIGFQTYDGTNSIAETVSVDGAPLGPLQSIGNGILQHSSLNLSLFGGAVRASSVDAGTITVQAVPETATWLLAVIGFGAIGAALRRRPAVVAFAR